MPVEVSCPHCRKKLRAPDKYMGKTVKCPHCQVPFAVQVDGGSKAADAGDDNSKWHVQTEDNQQYGPVTGAELRDWVREGRLDDRCQVLRADWDQWKWADEVFPELKGGASTVPSPTAPSGAAPTVPTPNVTPAAPAQIPTPAQVPTPAPTTTPTPFGQAPTVPTLPTAPTSQPAFPAAPTVPTIDSGGSSIHAGGPIGNESKPAFNIQADAGASATGNPYQTTSSPASSDVKGMSETRRFYARTAPWLLFLSIMAFVGTGLAALSVVLNISRGINLKMSGFFFVAVMNSAVGFFYFFMPGWLMIKYYSAINLFLREDSPRASDHMLHRCHAFWQYKGILTIVTVSLIILLIILTLSGVNWISGFFPMFR